MNWPLNTRGSFPIIIGSTDGLTPLTGIVAANFGTFRYKPARVQGTASLIKSLSAGSFHEHGFGIYSAILDTADLGTVSGLLHYVFYTKKGLPYYGLFDLRRHILDYLGTISSTLGTHLQSRVPGTSLTKGEAGSIKGAGFFAGTHSLVQIRNNTNLGSAPSYVGSAVWNKNPTNFLTADTMGQRINKILERASSGVGGVGISTKVFGEKDKTLLLDWMRNIAEKLKLIEELNIKISSGGKEGVSEILVNLKATQTKLQENIAAYEKNMEKGRTSVNKNLDIILESLLDTIAIKKQIAELKNTVSTLGKENSLMLNELGEKKIKETVNNATGELRNLISQIISISNDITGKIKNNLMVFEEFRQSAKITDKAILSLIPTEKLKEIIEEINEQE